MKKYAATSLALVAALSLSACSVSQKSDTVSPATPASTKVVSATAVDKNSLFQYSTINAIGGGQFEGDLSLKELKTHGDMGLGTINDLDGEMIEIDSKFYQIDSTGKLKQLDEGTKTPFAVTTSFDPKDVITLTDVQDYKQFTEKVSDQFKNKNDFYAVRVTGTFKLVKARTVPKQSRPYPNLSEVVKHQAEFEFKEVKGTLFGFYTPNYAGTINVPGFHLHFITDDKTSGGHVLDVQFDNAKVEISPMTQFTVSLPQTEDFAKADLTKVTPNEIKAAEFERK